MSAQPFMCGKVDAPVRKFHACGREVHFLDVRAVGKDGFVACPKCNKATWNKDLLSAPLDTQAYESGI